MKKLGLKKAGIKKLGTLVLMGSLALGLMTGCSSKDAGDNGSQGADQGANQGSSLGQIAVVSREDGSGTRGAFVELTGVESKDDAGNKTDNTTLEALIANKTDVMLTQVQGNAAAIGYVSVGSLNENVKALPIDGVEPTAENIKSGAYTLARPFNIATKGDPTGLAKDFIDFIMSKEGQTVISGSYISIDEAAPAYAGSKPSGKIVVAGSSSVAPVMEKLKEAYLVVNPNAQVEVQQSDSSSGMKSTIEGVCDIGMASRELKDSEKADLKDMAIAIDGIAVIVNKENPITAITTDLIKKVYTGEITDWSAVK